MECEIRAARDDDAIAVSRVILSALRITNAKDYPDDVIRSVEQNFGPAEVLELPGEREVFVAVVEKQALATASLDGRMVRTVFVDPDAQGQGVGKLLMAEVERVAREKGIEKLTVPSSVTAEQFHSKLGFKAVRDGFYGEERTIIMERSLV